MTNFASSLSFLVLFCLAVLLDASRKTTMLQRSRGFTRSHAPSSSSSTSALYMKSDQQYVDQLIRATNNSNFMPFVGSESIRVSSPQRSSNSNRNSNSARSQKKRTYFLPVQQSTQSETEKEADENDSQKSEGQRTWAWWQARRSAERVLKSAIASDVPELKPYFQEYSKFLSSDYADVLQVGAGLLFFSLLVAVSLLRVTFRYASCRKYASFWGIMGYLKSPLRVVIQL